MTVKEQLLTLLEENRAANDWLSGEVLAEELGVKSSNIIIPEIGQVIEMSQDSLAITGVVPTGGVLVDGLGIGDVGNVVLRDRKHLSQDGLLIVVLAVDHETGAVVSGPDIISRGFVYVRESDDLFEGARAAVSQALKAYPTIVSGDWNSVKSSIREALQRYVYSTLKRSPMILPIISEI